MGETKESAASVPFVLCSNLVKIYEIGTQKVIALQGLNLSIARGEKIALIGPSGAGKTTLLNLLGGLDTPSGGNVQVAGRDLQQMTGRERVVYKRQEVGFVWQQPARNLLPYLTARENIELPMEYNGVPANACKKRAYELLEMVGLTRRADFFPDRLSGGEQQMVAMAIALANNPPLLLADEPTGQIDSESTMKVLNGLKTINQAYSTTIVVVTHSDLVASHLERVVMIQDGRTCTEIHRRKAHTDENVQEEKWIILDPTGHLQIPRLFINTLDMNDLVKMHLEPGHVSIWPGAKTPQERAQRESSTLPEDLATMFDYQQSEGLSIKIEKISRTYPMAEKRVQALQDVSFGVSSGSFSVVKGPSGSGKTTLLNIIACLDEPTSGVIRYGEQVSHEMTSQERIDFIREKVGFIFQTFGLIPFLSVEENIQVPLRLLNSTPQERQQRIEQALKLVGLAHRKTHRVFELSNGEQQRVAIARALVKQPSLILADEPTGQLDSLTGASIINLLKGIAEKTGVTVLVASHDPNVHEAAEWLFELRDGRLADVIHKNGD